MWSHTNGFYQSWTDSDKRERMCSAYTPMQAVSNPAVWVCFLVGSLLFSLLSLFCSVKCEEYFACVIGHTLSEKGMCVKKVK